MKEITAFAPASIANFNVGYDVLGVSLNNLGDQVKLVHNETQENKIISIENGEQIPTDVNKNCCSVVIRKMQEALGIYRGVDIYITKGFASGSGLGSSSASSAAAAFGYNELLGKPYSKKELVFFAAEGERVACGSAHIDNVAASILGGIVLASGNDVIELPVPKNLFATTLFPKITLNTTDSRKILKEHVSLKSASQQIGLMGMFVSSLYKNDLNGLSNSLQDILIEPMRSLLIPHFFEMKKAVKQCGGLAFGISGSGPSVFAISEGKTNAELITNVLEEVYVPLGIEFQIYNNALSEKSGARILK